MKKVGKIGSKQIIEVRTAKEITDEAIIKRLEKRLGQRSEVRLIIDSTIQGGIYIKDLLQNKHLDGSIRTQLQTLREKIIK